MRRVTKKAAAGKNEVTAFVCSAPEAKPDIYGKTRITIALPWLLAERAKCAAAFKGITIDAYIEDALSEWCRLDEGEWQADAVEAGVTKYLNRAGLSVDHPLRRVFEPVPEHGLNVLHELYPQGGRLVPVR